MSNHTILILGDIVGRIGREAVGRVLPSWRKQYAPSLVIGNGENLAHGFGVTPKTVREIFAAGVDVLTGGNHIWSNQAYKDVFADPELKNRVIRPLNDFVTEGVGYTIIEKNGGRFLVTNLTGITFMNEEYPNFFEAIDALLGRHSHEKFDGIFVDFHAEATSEKAVLGRYLDGKVSVFYGTHTHVQTSDERLLPLGTAFITDVGMCGAFNEAIGGAYAPILDGMKQGGMGTYEVPQTGATQVNAILVDMEEGKPKAVRRLVDIVER